MKRICSILVIILILFACVAESEARWYSPEMRRFISEDPIGFAGGDVNFYAYVRNNPVNYVDPLGLSFVEIHPDTIASRGDYEKGLVSLGLSGLPSWAKDIMYNIYLGMRTEPSIGPTMCSAPFSGGKQALVAIAKHAKKVGGVTGTEAKILLKWAKEYKLEGLDHINTTHWSGGPHIKIGPINHIPVE